MNAISKAEESRNQADYECFNALRELLQEIDSMEMRIPSNVSEKLKEARGKVKDRIKCDGALVEVMRKETEVRNKLPHQHHELCEFLGGYTRAEMPNTTKAMGNYFLAMVTATKPEDTLQKVNESLDHFLFLVNSIRSKVKSIYGG